MKEEGYCFEQSYCNCHCYYIYNIIKQCNNVFVLFLNLSLLLQIHQFTFNIIFILNSLLCGTKLKLQVCYTSIRGGAFWGFNQYCICNYYGGVCLLVIVLPLLLEIQKGVSEIFLVFHAYGANLYCIWDSYGSLCFYLLLLLMCL